MFDDGQNDPDVDEEVEGASTVDDGLLDRLAKQLHYANLVYEAAEDPKILDMLQEDGFGLNFFKKEAEWDNEGAHKPAFFVATNTEAKQLLVSIRGTSDMQDVMADIVAVPEEYDGTGKQAHSGMGQAAAWMLERILPLAQALSKAGYTIILTGHSLGAGAAALLGLSLKNRGIKQVEAYGFATPPCMAGELAQQCDFFHSVAHRDDVVMRFCPQSLAALHKDLREYDWEAAAKDRGPHNPMLGNMSKLAKVVNKLRGMSGHEEDDPDAKGEKMEQLEQKLQEYQPLIPGKVVYAYRARPVLKATEAPDLQTALVDGSCPQLRKLHINAFMVADHLIPSYFTALGRPNPVEQRREEEQRKKEAEEEEQKRKQEQDGDDD
ncbi:hypothetical protein WJX73_004270 [Symbiochloris irregularis]|uniref:sn-1-specific diacylglycerol lipase n=1 Tax=Symbiochloris irregularis TaxID=706552 RepID=A0AAW1PW11_9CHLO